MSYKLDLDTRSEDRRGYVPRHGKPDTFPEPVKPPAWANEHARPIPALVGEAPTKLIPYPSWVAPESLPMPLPARAEGAALEALRVPEPKPSLLGQCLHALGIRWPR